MVVGPRLLRPKPVAPLESAPRGLTRFAKRGPLPPGAGAWAPAPVPPAYFPEPHEIRKVGADMQAWGFEGGFRDRPPPSCGGSELPRPGPGPRERQAVGCRAWSLTTTRSRSCRAQARSPRAAGVGSAHFPSLVRRPGGPVNRGFEPPRSPTASPATASCPAYFHTGRGAAPPADLEAGSPLAGRRGRGAADVPAFFLPLPRPWSAGAGITDGCRVAGDPCRAGGPAWRAADGPRPRYLGPAKPSLDSLRHTLAASR